MNSEQLFVVIVFETGQNVKIPITAKGYSDLIESFDELMSGSFPKMYYHGTDAYGNDFNVLLGSNTLSVSLDSGQTIGEGMVEFVIYHEKDGEAKIIVEKSEYDHFIDCCKTNRGMIMNYSGTDSHKNPFRIRVSNGVVCIRASAPVSREELI